MFFLGSGCGSVGRAVASDYRGLLFESSHLQKFTLNIYCQLYYKDKNKEKSGLEWPIEKNVFSTEYDKKGAFEK